MENHSRKEFYSIKFSPQTWKHNYMVQSDPYGRKKKLSFMMYFKMTLQNYYIHGRTPKSLFNYPYKERFA